MLNASTRNFNKNKIILSAFDNLKIDIGCGDEKHNAKIHGLEGYIGIDVMDFGQDIIWDIEKGLPFPNNSCINIFCSHVVEHINDLIGLMNEFWRVLKPDGELYIICPHKDSENAYVLHHIRRFDKKTFEAMAWDWKPEQQIKRDYDILPWKIIELILNERGDIHFKAKPNKDYDTKKV